MATTWEAAAAELVGLLTDWQSPIRAARSAGVTPDYVLRVLRHYRAAGGRFGPGALHGRLCRAHPDQPPEDGWPEPREVATAATSATPPPEQRARSIERSIVRGGRSAGASDEQIRARIREAFEQEKLPLELAEF